MVHQRGMIKLPRGRLQAIAYAEGTTGVNGVSCPG